MKIQLPRNSEWKHAADHLWSGLVKDRAAWETEIEDERAHGTLTAHHVCGKDNLELRYALESGICVSFGQHFHHHVKANPLPVMRYMERHRAGDLAYIESLVHAKPGAKKVRDYFDDLLELAKDKPRVMDYFTARCPKSVLKYLQTKEMEK